MNREEAINEIRSWDSITEEKMKVLQTLIPELNESEDEILRKKLIKDVEEYFPYDLAKKYIEYLVKIKDSGNNVDRCDIDEFIFTLRCCLIADSELTEEQATIFANAYGEALLDVATGKTNTGFNKEDIIEYNKTYNITKFVSTKPDAVLVLKKSAV